MDSGFWIIPEAEDTTRKPVKKRKAEHGHDWLVVYEDAAEILPLAALGT